MLKVLRLDWFLLNGYNIIQIGAASYMQVTKFDIIHNTQYTDCKGNVRLVTEETSTILATSETITTLVPEVNKVIVLTQYSRYRFLQQHNNHMI